MTEIEEHSLEARLLKLERLFRDIKISLIIIGLCIAAFLGYQSYVGIPKAISESFNSSTIKEVEIQAAKYMTEISKFHQTSKVLVENLEKEELNSAIANNKEESTTLGKRLTHLEAIIHGHYLYVYNSCSQPIDIWLRYTGPFRDVRSKGKWSVPANSGTYPTISGEKIVLVESEIYYYAKTTSGTPKYWRGGEIVKVNGEELGMKKGSADNEEFRYVFNLTCS